MSGGRRGTSKRPLSADERALWQEITKSVRAYNHDPVETPDAPVAPAASDTKSRRRPVLPIHHTPAAPAPKPLIHGDTSGMDGRTARKLKRGKLAIDDTIDLHGHTQAAAHRALERFIADNVARGSRTVRVITGKGDPVAGRPGILKTAVPGWLNEMPLRQWVSGFSYAAVKDGGEGALYVRLKRNRGERR